MLETIIICIAVVIFIIIEWTFRTHKNKKRLLREIRESWGKTPDNEYDKRDMKRFSQFFEYYAKQKTEYVIDDITWNDLELEKFYTMINSTHTSMGDEVLYSMLRTPLYDKGLHNERLELIRFWESHPEDRMKIQQQLLKFGKWRHNGASALLAGLDYLELKYGNHYKYLSFLPIVCLPLIFLSVGAGVLFFILSLGINVFYHERQVKDIEQNLSTISSAATLVSLAGSIKKLNIKGLDAHFKKLDEVHTVLKTVNKYVSPANYVNKTNLALGQVAELTKAIIVMTFLTDLWAYSKALKCIIKYKNELAQLIELIGTLDATICIASYKNTLTTLCDAEVIWDKSQEVGMGHDTEQESDCIIKAVSVRHPLIENCTPNPVIVRGPVLLTGSNASGKSTYLKTVAMNTLLVHTMGICLASEWVSVPLFPVTSMALRDSIVDGESYFVAEIKSFKRIFSVAERKIKTLCIIDEVLRGTNTIERIAASSQLLYRLSKLNTSIFAATHDVELTMILENNFENKHFEETVSNNEISFDYQLKEGRSSTRNAIKLLGLMGFDESVVQRANEAVSLFERNQVWERVL